MLERHLETIKGVAVSGCGLAAWVISRVEVAEWVQFATLIGSLILILLTIVEKLRKWNRPECGRCREEEE